MKNYFFKPELENLSQGARLKNADIIIKCPSNKTERIQEIHIMIIHYICAKIEEEYI